MATDDVARASALMGPVGPRPRGRPPRATTAKPNLAGGKRKAEVPNGGNGSGGTEIGSSATSLSGGASGGGGVADASSLATRDASQKRPKRGVTHKDSSVTYLTPQEIANREIESLKAQLAARDATIAVQQKAITTTLPRCSICDVATIDLLHMCRVHYCCVNCFTQQMLKSGIIELKIKQDNGALRSPSTSNLDDLFEHRGQLVISQQREALQQFRCSARCRDQPPWRPDILTKQDFVDDVFSCRGFSNGLTLSEQRYKELFTLHEASAASLSLAVASAAAVAGAVAAAALRIKCTTPTCDETFDPKNPLAFLMHRFRCVWTQPLQCFVADQFLRKYSFVSYGECKAPLTVFPMSAIKFKGLLHSKTLHLTEHIESAVLDHVLEHCQLPIGSCSSCDGHPHEATDSKHVEMHADLDRTAKKLHSLSNIVSSRLPKGKVSSTDIQATTIQMESCVKALVLLEIKRRTGKTIDLTDKEWKAVSSLLSTKEFRDLHFADATTILETIVVAKSHGEEVSFTRECDECIGSNKSCGRCGTLTQRESFFWTVGYPTFVRNCWTSWYRDGLHGLLTDHVKDTLIKMNPSPTSPEPQDDHVVGDGDVTFLGQSPAASASASASASGSGSLIVEAAVVSAVASAAAVASASASASAAAAPAPAPAFAFASGSTGAYWAAHPPLDGEFS